MIRRRRATASTLDEWDRQFAERSATSRRKFDDRRAKVLEACDAQRLQTLGDWDAAEERVFDEYETRTVDARSRRARVLAIDRRRRAEATRTIDAEHTARVDGIRRRHDEAAKEPPKVQRQSLKRVADARHRFRASYERAGTLVARRLDGAPPPAATPPAASDPTSDDDPSATIESVVDALRRATADVDRWTSDRQTTGAAKIAEGWRIPAGAAATAAASSAAVLAVGGRGLWWLALIVAVSVGFGAFVAMVAASFPLKRQTRESLPVLADLAAAADAAVIRGKRIANRTLEDAVRDLADRRDAAIAAADDVRATTLTETHRQMDAARDEQLRVIDGEIELITSAFEQQHASVEREMRALADQTAADIRATIETCDDERRREVESETTAHHDRRQRTLAKLAAGEAALRRRLDRHGRSHADDLQPWDGDGPPRERPGHPVGWIRVGADPTNESPHDDAREVDGEPKGTDCLALPLTLDSRSVGTLVLRCDASHRSAAAGVLRGFLWRTLAGRPPGSVRVTLIDPVARGDHFATLTPLTDFDASPVGPRVWSDESEIESRLAEAVVEMENLLQTTLRDRHAHLDDYNATAGELAVPTHVIAMVGHPTGLTRTAAAHLDALVRGGRRCGIVCVLSSEGDDPPAGRDVLTLRRDDERWVLTDGPWSGHSADVPDEPPGDVRRALIRRIGRAADAAACVEVPIEKVLAECGSATGDTADGLTIPFGVGDGGRVVSLRLGHGVAQHALVVGKTGSGKSSLLHALVTAAVHRYTPDELHLYLLDFKKGVEFRVYADGPPHVRVVGIESEREFGVSALRRLDEELTARGESFRDAGVSSLADFRRETGLPLPRVLLVVDEFQEWFVRDDRLSSEATMLLDRLVRQGRSFGVHVVLASQSLSGAYSLPRVTLGQMAVRIALRCGEADATTILADDNPAAASLRRPGQAIYNESAGAREANRSVQVARVRPEVHRERLAVIEERDVRWRGELPPPVVFDGHRPAVLTDAMIDGAAAASRPDRPVGLLGESVRIGPPAMLPLPRDAGRNVLMIAPGPAVRGVMLGVLSSVVRTHPDVRIVHLSGGRREAGEDLSDVFAALALDVETATPRDAVATLSTLSETLSDRAPSDPPTIVVIDPLDRFRDLRQDDAFAFNLDVAAPQPDGGAVLQTLLADGPAAGVHTFVVAGAAETISRYLPRASLHDLSIRLLGNLTAADSSLLIDSPAASHLSPATLLHYDDTDGHTSAFRYVRTGPP